MQTLLDTLMARARDKTSWTRACVCRTWGVLAEGGKVPMGHWNAVAEVAIGAALLLPPTVPALLAALSGLSSSRCCNEQSRGFETRTAVLYECQWLYRRSAAAYTICSDINVRRYGRQPYVDVSLLTLSTCCST